MKVFKKGVILPCECENCHTVFQPKWRKIYHSRYVKCPMCNSSNTAKFAKNEIDWSILLFQIMTSGSVMKDE